MGGPYLPGDANLDGTVDGQDFIEWNMNKFMSVASWCSGDFNADGMVDGQDFIEWNMNKFMSSDSFAAAVPEPASLFPTLGLIGLALLRRRKLEAGPQCSTFALVHADPFSQLPLCNTDCSQEQLA